MDDSEQYKELRKRKDKILKKKARKDNIAFLIKTFAVIGFLLLVGFIVSGIRLEKYKHFQPLTAKQEQVLKLISGKLKYGESKPLIDYDRYGWTNDEFANCKDFAFAFSVLYGSPAEVVGNRKHVFNRIESNYIEPQLTNGSYLPQENYSIRNVITIHEDDVKTIIDFFKE